MLNKRFLHKPVPSLLLRLLAVMVLYSLLRVVFYAYNASEFPQASAMSYLYGLRFDTTAMLYTNLLIILLSIWPAKFVAKKWYGILVAVLFVLCNAIPFALNLVDVGYFPFVRSRSTFSLFGFVSEIPNIGNLMSVFALEYWHLLLIFVAVVVALSFVAKYTMVDDVPDFYSSVGNGILHIGTRLVLVGLVVVGIRGGFQLKPISNSTAAAYENGNNTALILNTPFSIIRSVGMSELDEKSFFETDEQALEYFNPHKSSHGLNAANFPLTDNVVIIILEGISSEYSDYLSSSPKKLAGYTPFIDSLARNSMVFKGYANGLQSIVALSSVLGSVPSLSETPFSKSRYVMNTIDYPTKFLAGRGYKTAFFHGADNGTMGFDNLCKILNVNDYYGFDEYPDKSDYDGTWGIPDYQYLQYVADVLDTYDNRFVATVFTITSHHPFIVPSDYDAKLPKGDFPMQHTVAYTDMALQKFFDKISKSKWYDRTLFVITADHTNFTGADEIDYNKLYDVPMILYHPKADTAFLSDRVMQQIDIMPSIISYIGEKGDFTAFGTDVFDTLQLHFAVSKRDDYCTFVLNGKKIRIYDNGEVSVVNSNDGNLELSDYEYNFVRAYIQCYNNGMRNNTLHIE